MKDYIFCMNAEAETQTASQTSFKTYIGDAGTDYNPLGKSYFNKPERMTGTEDDYQITSIPTPYARMHITDIAFRELVAGKTVLSDEELANKIVSGDYLKAMSHCLDLFELLYRADEVDLPAHGITIKKIKLVGTADLQSTNPHYAYIQTLELFRKEYNKVIAKRKEDKGPVETSYRFDFTSLYLFKYKSVSFAATSPLTGFFSKATCNIAESGLRLDGRLVLSSNPATWLALKDRKPEFIKFLYMLFHSTGLEYIYENLFNAVKQCISDPNIKSYNDSDFSKEYPRFNIGAQPLMKLQGKEDYLRPDGMDNSYLKYLLYLDVPIDFSIKPEDYKAELKDRKFPTGSQKHVRWLGVNDFLADALFILPYDVKDKYVAIPYIKENKESCRRCLPPVKKEFLNYFTINQLVNPASPMISIQRTSDDRYIVKLVVPVEEKGVVTLRKEYKKDGEYPNGKVFDGETMNPFAFGIYPFVKVTNASTYGIDNIYKILFYNSFSESYSLKFYRFDDNREVEEIADAFIRKNRTNRSNNNIACNTEYYQVNAKTAGFDFAELDFGNNLSTLLVPKLILKDVTESDEIYAAIDLGTSNTYVAYAVIPDSYTEDECPCREVLDTKHEEFTEFELMNDTCEDQNLHDELGKNRKDLIISLLENSEVSPEYLKHQLCEFIPANFGCTGYRFPVPTVINFLRREVCTDKDDKDNKDNNERIPMVDCCIPFAYYEIGKRYYGKDENPKCDTIHTGANFKWFSRKVNGIQREEPIFEKCFKAFVDELLFIMRSHFLCRGYSLSRCKLIWSYPLSFSKELVEKYKKVWIAGYEKYFYNDPKNIYYSNESRTPIFAIQKDNTAVDNFTVLMDIGGGSTDIIGYKERKAHFITSFGFAGNALYAETNRDENVLDLFVNSRSLFADGKLTDPVLSTRRISKDDPISQKMNYGFAKDPEGFGSIFTDDIPNFLLLFHNSALIYQTAQLCKQVQKEKPLEIYLSGNGSKLFLLKEVEEATEIFNTIFDFVYNDGKAICTETNVQIKIKPAENPKAATAEGAIIGLHKKELNVNKQADNNRYIALGNASSFFTDKEVEQMENSKLHFADIRNNVVRFIDMFYEKIYPVRNAVISKKEMRDILNIAAPKDLIVADEETLTDSLFFEYINKIIYKVSRTLYEKVKPEFK